MSALLGFAGRVLDTRERIPRVLSLVLPPNNQGAAITEDIAIVSLTGHKQTIRLHRHVYTASRLGHYDKCTARMLHSSSTSHSALPRLFLIPKLTIFLGGCENSSGKSHPSLVPIVMHIHRAAILSLSPTDRPCSWLSGWLSFACSWGMSMEFRVYSHPSQESGESPL